MITYEFTEPKGQGCIFKHDHSKDIEEYVETNIRITIPFTDVRKIGSDRLQDILKEDVSDMVEALNRKISRIIS